MKKKLLFSLLTVALAFSQTNCAKNAAENSNQTNANQPPAQTSPAVDANVKTVDAPVPTFTNADEALAEGKRLLDALETDKAIDALSQAVKLNPDLADAHFNLGIAYALVEKDEQDKELTQVETTPTPKTSKNSKKNAAPVRTKNSEKAFENAVKAYKKIIAKNDKDDAAQFNLGRALNKLNEDEDSMKALREAVKLKPDDAEYQLEYGKILIKLAQYDEAVAALKKSVSLDATNLDAQEELEKAEAGKKRVDFGNKPKLPQEQEQSKKRSAKSDEPDDSDASDDSPEPEKSPAAVEKKPDEKKPAEKKPAEKKPAEKKSAKQ